MQTGAPSDFPLLIKSLLRTPLQIAPDAEIVSDGLMRYSYRDFEGRVKRFAAGLAAQGIGPGQVVAVMDWDTHRYFEAFFAVPMMGAVLHTVNIRLAPAQIAYTIDHAEDDVILVHADFLPLLSEVMKLVTRKPSDAEGRAWDLRTSVEGDDAEAVNAAILTDLQEGAASVLISGGVLADAATLGRALDGVALELAPVALGAGFAGVAAAEALAVVAKGSPRAMLRFHLDPISAFAEAGGSPRGIDDDLGAAADAAVRHAGVYPDASLFLASGRVAHEAGGSAAQELAFAASGAVAYVKAAVAAGLSVEAALKGVVLGLSVDQEYFDALAKVRAMRLIWANLSRAFGAETPAVIEARSSRRMLSARDPWPNLLRLTAAGFAGAVGGADVVGAGRLHPRLGAARRLRPQTGAQYAVGPDGGGQSGPGRRSGGGQLVSGRADP